MLSSNLGGEHGSVLENVAFNK